MKALWDEWYQANATPDFRARKRVQSNARYNANREAINARRKQRATAARRAESPTEREARLTVRRARYARNAEHYRLKHLDYTHSRNARIRGNRAETVSLLEVLDRHGMVCHICGGAIATRADLHFDHVVPLSKGGEHSYENIRPAHAVCNLRKADRLI